MKCNNCQTFIPEGAKFCPGCGAKVEAPQTAPEAKSAANPFIGALNNLHPLNQESADQQPIISEPAPETVTGEPVSETCDTEPTSTVSAPEPQPFTPPPAPQPESFGAEPVNPQPDYTDPYNSEDLGENKSSRKRSPIVPIIVIAIIAVVVGVAAKFMFSGGMGGKYVTQKTFIRLVYNSEEDETHIIYNGKAVGTFDGDYYRTAYGANGSVVAILTDDYTLYTADKGGVTEIADDVNNMALSQNGKKLVYADDENTIYMISADGKNEKVISEDQDGELQSLAISPDGKSVVYCFSDDGDLYSAAYINGKEAELDDEFIPYTVSNGGKTVFGSDENNDGAYAYDIKSEDLVQISEDGDLCAINAGKTEMLYMDGGKAYLYIDGESKKIGKYSSIDVISLYDKDITAVSTFVGIPLRFTDNKGNNGIGYLNKDGEMEVLTDELEVSYFRAIDDAKTIFYIDDTVLYKATEKDDYDPEKIAKDVSAYYLSRDGKKIYYLDDEDTLYLIDGEDKTEIEDDVASISGVDSDGNVYFIVYDDGDDAYAFYRYSGGKKAELIAEDVARYAYAYSDSIRYMTVDEDGNTTAYYISKDGKNFQAIFEN